MFGFYAMFNQRKIMNQGQRNRSKSHRGQNQEGDENGPYFKIIRDYRNSHSPLAVQNPKIKWQKEVKGSSEQQSQSFGSINAKKSSRNKKNRDLLSQHSRNKRQISTRYRQENEVQFNKKMQVWSEMWKIELNFLRQEKESDLLTKLNRPMSKAQKKCEKVSQPLQQQLLCDSQPIYLPQLEGMEMEEKRPEQDENKNTDENKKQQDFFIYHIPYYDHENSLFNEENNSFFFDRVND